MDYILSLLPPLCHCCVMAPNSIVMVTSINIRSLNSYSCYKLYWGDNFILSDSHSTNIIMIFCYRYSHSTTFSLHIIAPRFLHSITTWHLWSTFGAPSGRTQGTFGAQWLANELLMDTPKYNNIIQWQTASKYNPKQNSLSGVETVSFLSWLLT